MKIINSIGAFFCILLAVPSIAQDTWSLEKCILHSQKASIAINQSELGISQADISLDQAKQARYPSLNMHFLNFLQHLY